MLEKPRVLYTCIEVLWVGGGWPVPVLLGVPGGIARLGAGVSPRPPLLLPGRLRPLVEQNIFSLDILLIVNALYFLCACMLNICTAL